VTDVNESPNKIRNLSKLEIPETTQIGGQVVVLEITDPDRTERLTANILKGVDTFSLDPAGMQCKVFPKFESIRL